ncbi:MAG: helix-turn-helix transcriptional regulator [Actinobacteria bacterium]|nr:helix-turn-helix transcriptional regulator [Actinomycetota bacterium]
MYRDLFLGFVKVHILHHAARGSISGVGMSSELARHGYSISPGTLYPTLRKLERDGYLKSWSGVEGGRRRVYYTATAKGRKALEKARVQALELVREIMEDREA